MSPPFFDILEKGEYYADKKTPLHPYPSVLEP